MKTKPAGAALQTAGCAQAAAITCEKNEKTMPAAWQITSCYNITFVIIKTALDVSPIKQFPALVPLLPLRARQLAGSKIVTALDASLTEPGLRLHRRTPEGVAWRFLLLVIGYYASGRMGLAIPFVGSHVTLLWLPTGIAVAALMRWGWAYWPGIYLGAVLVNLSIASSWPLAGSIAIGNTLGPLLAVFVLRQSGFHTTFDRQKDVALFAIAAGIGMMLSATGGVTSLNFYGQLPGSMLSSAWPIWWLGDTLGVLIAAPLLLTLRRDSRRELSGRRSELAIWCLLFGCVAWAAFVLNVGYTLPLVFLTLPLVVWAALRFGVTGASLAVLGLAAIAAWGTASGRGPFYQINVHQGLMLLWAYMATSVLVGLLITALQAERGRAEAAINRANERLNSLIEAIPDAIFCKDGQGRWLITNETAKSLFQLHGIDWQGRTDDEIAFLRPGFNKEHNACIDSDEQAWQARGLSLIEERVIADDGSERTFEVRKVPTFEADGQRKGLIIIGRDLSDEHRARREIERLSQRNELLLMAAGEGIFGIDREERTTFINPAALRMLGYDAGEVIGVGQHALFHHSYPDGRPYPEAACPIRRTLGDGLPRHDLDEWFIRKDGSGFPVALTVSPIHEQGVLTGAVVSFQDATQRKAAEAEIHRLAFYDPLSGLPNRRLLHDRLLQALAASKRRKAHGAVLFLDLDNFKALNDTLGHDVGDLLLIDVAQRLAASVRAEDTVARLGGDEFVIVLENLSVDGDEAAQQAEVVSEKIRLALNQPYQLDGREHYSTPSMGVSLFRDGSESVDDLLKHADVALYKAKNAGRNTIRFFDPAMQAALDARATLEAELRQALVREQFRLHYQLQVDGQQRVLGAEVLLRWQHPARGLVAPADFIPLAEDSGLIVPIGLWVLETTCTQLKRWEGSPLTRDLPLAVNISARQFRQSDFVEQVRGILQRTGAKPSRLKFELTESLVLHHVGDVVDKMHALKELGISFSMDDFGTGYSSLAYLKQLPIDQLKIDQSFVQHLASDACDAAIVQTIIGVARGLGLEVIAEGVETAAQHEFLEQYGCPAFQGYLFSHPLPLAEFEHQLA